MSNNPSRFPEGVRLSPVEQANIALINDPALDGYRVQGRLRPESPEVDGLKGDGEGSGPGSQRKNPAEDDPTRLDHIVADVIRIGPEIITLGEGPHGPVAHEAVEVDEANPWFSTDGKAVYSKDGATLIRLVVECQSYAVPETCQRIGDRAFDSMSCLSSVKLPQSLTRIGRLAFAKSGLTSLEVPSSVELIDEKAFYACKSLKACQLAEGLREIGEGAFALSLLERMEIPATVQIIGHGAFDRTPAAAQAPLGTITVDEANGRFSIDAEGGLYQDGDMAELLSDVRQYRVCDGARRILAEAFRRKARLASVSLPYGVVEIGDNAFRGCRLLSEVDLPESLESIGDGAFMDTCVRELSLSAQVRHIGELALLVQGSNHGRENRTLQRLDLDPSNHWFYTESGILCERGAGEGGQDKAVLYVGPDTTVTIPDQVNRLAPYAFFGASDIAELFVHGHMQSICYGSLSVGVSIPLIHVEIPARLPQEVPEGGFVISSDPELSEWASTRWITLHVPSLSPRFRVFTELFTTDGSHTVFMFPYFDAWVTNARSVSEFALAAVERLRDPVMLDEEVKGVYQDILRRKQLPVCQFFASRGDRDALEDLMAWQVLDASTIDQALASSIEAHDTQATACLLLMQNEHSTMRGLDLSI